MFDTSLHHAKSKIYLYIYKYINPVLDNHDSMPLFI